MAEQAAKPTSKKLQKFLKEVNALCEKYQYKFVPVLSYNKKGVFPTLEVEDTLPVKKEKK